NMAGWVRLASYFQMCRAGSLNWSASRPKPGMFAVQPQPQFSKPRKVMRKASPGSAPSTSMGPRVGLILPKSSRARSSAFQSGVIWPQDGSRHSNSSTSPGAALATGGLALVQPIWCWWPWIVLPGRCGCLWRISRLLLLDPDRVEGEGLADDVAEHLRRALQPLGAERVAVRVEQRHPGRVLVHDVGHDLAPFLDALRRP